MPRKQKPQHPQGTPLRQMKNDDAIMAALHNVTRKHNERKQLEETIMEKQREVVVRLPRVTLLVASLYRVDDTSITHDKNVSPIDRIGSGATRVDEPDSKERLVEAREDIKSTKKVYTEFIKDIKKYQELHNETVGLVNLLTAAVEEPTRIHGQRLMLIVNDQAKQDYLTAFATVVMEIPFYEQTLIKIEALVERFSEELAQFKAAEAAKAAPVAVKKNPTERRATAYAKKIKQALEGAKQFIEKPDTKNWFVSGLALIEPDYITEQDRITKPKSVREPYYIPESDLKEEFYPQFQILTNTLIQNLFPHIESNGIKDLALESVPDEAPEKVLSSHNVQELRGDLTRLVSASEEYKREAKSFFNQLASKILGTDVYWDESLLTEAGEAAMSSVSAFNIYDRKIVAILDKTLSSKCQEITDKMNDEDREAAAAAVGVCLGRVAISAKGVSETSIEYAKRVLTATKPQKREAAEESDETVDNDGMTEAELINPYVDKIVTLFSSEKKVKDVTNLLRKIELEQPTIKDLRSLLERLGFTPEEALVKVPDSTGGGHPVVKIPNFFGLNSNAIPEVITVALVHGKDTITRAGLKAVRNLLNELEITSEGIETKYQEYKKALDAGAGADAGTGAGAGAGTGAGAGAGAGTMAGAGAGSDSSDSDKTSDTDKSWVAEEKKRRSLRSSSPDRSGDGDRESKGDDGGIGGI